MAARRRLDVEMVRRGLASSRAKAASIVEEGHVLVSGTVAEKPSRLVAPGEPVSISEAPRYVSRGGLKLEAALQRFEIEVTGRRCLDAGASTGGFTDCLLQHGAASVMAVDVGRGQLDSRLRNDPRVTVLDEINVRSLAPAQVGEPVEIVTADLSFISLVTVAGALVAVAAPDADHVVLLKPQFEAGRDQIGKGGIVRDPRVHREVIARVLAGLAARGLAAVDLMASPLRGPRGNVEFLAHLRAGDAPPLAAGAIDRAVADAHAPSDASS